jgi:hypothetical protein
MDDRSSRAMSIDIGSQADPLKQLSCDIVHDKINPTGSVSSRNDEEYRMQFDRNHPKRVAHWHESPRVEVAFGGEKREINLKWKQDSNVFDFARLPARGPEFVDK